MAGPTKGIVPHIVVDNAAAAIDFYVKAFGAKEVSRAPMKKGLVNTVWRSMTSPSRKRNKECDGTTRPPVALIR